MEKAARKEELESDGIKEERESEIGRAEEITQ
jgi:hypothetical protein